MGPDLRSHGLRGHSLPKSWLSMPCARLLPLILQTLAACTPIAAQGPQGGGLCMLATQAPIPPTQAASPGPSASRQWQCSLSHFAKQIQSILRQVHPLIGLCSHVEAAKLPSQCPMAKREVPSLVPTRIIEAAWTYREA